MKAIFLDRDGVINSYPGDSDYVKSWEEFHFLPKAMPALKRLNEKGFKLFIISNQAGISKGIYSQESLNLITKNMLAEFRKEDIEIAGAYFCIHSSGDNCSCRKPKTGLVDLAIDKLKYEGSGVDLKNSYFIGDTIRDVQTGKTAGLATILVFSGKEKPENKNNWQVLPDFTANDLAAAVDIILK